MTKPVGPAQHAYVGSLRLELQINSDTPLEGSLSAGDGTTRAFAGWPGLASTLTAFLEDWEHEDLPPSGGP